MVKQHLVPSIFATGDDRDPVCARSTRSARTRKSLAALVPIILSTAVIGVAGADAATKPFGCTSGNRSISATVFYAQANAGTWSVDHINYNYSNSGGGKANTNFRVDNGAGTPVWSWSTPDDRDDRSYTKDVSTLASKGNGARAHQTTWFDVFGNDPSCSGSGNL